jgi:anti-sigma-K factor RskA
MTWSARFPDPIPCPVAASHLSTLQEAGAYVQKLAKNEALKLRWLILSRQSRSGAIARHRRGKMSGELGRFQFWRFLLAVAATVAVAGGSYLVIAFMIGVMK